MGLNCKRAGSTLPPALRLFCCWLFRVIQGPDPQRRLGSIHTAKLTGEDRPDFL